MTIDSVWLWQDRLGGNTTIMFSKDEVEIFYALVSCRNFVK